MNIQPNHIFILQARIQHAGIPIRSLFIDGRIDFRPQATASQREQAFAILAAYDPEAEDTQIATKNALTKATLDELRDAKVATALSSIASDLAQIDTAAPAQVRDMLKRALVRQDKIIRALSFIAE